MNLRKYSGSTAKCPKCGSVGATTAYYASGLCNHGHDGDHSVLDNALGNLGQPRMHRCCATCGYAWDELPSDTNLVPLETQAEVMVTVIQEELVALWDDLLRARRHAINGKWSIECDSVAGRIETLTRVVGPTPHDAVPVDLVLDGTYERLHKEWGVEHPPIDHAALQKWWDDYQAQQGATVTRLRP